MSNADVSTENQTTEELDSVQSDDLIVFDDALKTKIQIRSKTFKFSDIRVGDMFKWENEVAFVVTNVQSSNGIMLITYVEPHGLLDPVTTSVELFSEMVTSGNFIKVLTMYDMSLSLSEFVTLNDGELFKKDGMEYIEIVATYMTYISSQSDSQRAVLVKLCQDNTTVVVEHSHLCRSIVRECDEFKEMRNIFWGVENG